MYVTTSRKAGTRDRPFSYPSGDCGPVGGVRFRDEAAMLVASRQEEVAMIVVSVINYKGGVGKTTLTANLGAELAFRGSRVLLIDLDPQASLTFSFYRPGDWEKNLADEHTLLSWYGSVIGAGPIERLGKYVQTPPEVNRLIQDRGNASGRLDLLASHLDLIDVDLDFAY